MKSRKEYRPSGTRSANALRNARSDWSSMPANVASTAPAPKRSTISSMRRLPTRTAAMIAEMSPRTMSGKRVLRTNVRISSSFHAPSRNTREGGMIIPSWNTSVAAGEIEPGTMPPMSQRWPQASAKATTRAPLNTGATKTMSLLCETAPREPYESL